MEADKRRIERRVKIVGSFGSYSEEFKLKEIMKVVMWLYEYWTNNLIVIFFSRWIWFFIL
ncbi:unnamed protein product [Camellia sinensis]